MDDGEIYQFLMVCILREGKYLISDSMCGNERKGSTLANYLHHDFFSELFNFIAFGEEKSVDYICILVAYQAAHPRALEASHTLIQFPQPLNVIT